MYVPMYTTRTTCVHHPHHLAVYRRRYTEQRHGMAWHGMTQHCPASDVHS